MACRACNADDTPCRALGGVRPGLTALGACKAKGAADGRAFRVAGGAGVRRRGPILSGCPSGHARASMTRVAAVLWSGAVGGAETFTADLCRKMRELGADVRI